MQADVPLVIPEVNGEHLKVLQTQEWFRNKRGFMVTNPNCSAIGLVMALAPLHRKLRVEKVFVTTMQASSGRGDAGVASLDILGNVLPHMCRVGETSEAA